MKKGITRSQFLKAGAVLGFVGGTGLGLFGCSEQSGSGNETGPITFAVVVPLSGPGAPDGQQVLAGAQYAAEEINQNGGILGGRNIEIASYDDEGTPETGVTVVRRAITSDGVDVVTGGFNSPVSLATAPIIAQQNKLNIVTVSRSTEIIEESGDQLLFKLNSSIDTDADFYAEFISNTIEPQSVYFLATNDEYGREETTRVSAELESAGIEIAGTDYVDRTRQDFTSQLLKIERANPDAVYVPISNTSQGAQVYEQAEQQNLDATFLTGVGTLNYTVIELAGEAAAEGLYGMDIYARGANTPQNNAFVEGYEADTEYKAEKIALLGYESIRLPALAIDEAGTIEPDQVAETLLSQEWESPRGTVSFEDTGQAASDRFPIIVRSSEIRAIDSENGQTTADGENE